MTHSQPCLSKDGKWLVFVASPGKKPASRRALLVLGTGLHTFSDLKIVPAKALESRTETSDVPTHDAGSSTFATGAAVKDPSGLFNSSLDGNVRRAIDIHEGDKLDEAALKDLIGVAAALNLKGKSKPKPRRARSKRAD